jgi:Domain of unknown function (DUF4267)
MSNPSTKTIGLARSPGFWLALLMVLSQWINALRAFHDPVAFARYLGLPLIDPLDIGFVSVYGLRALFMGLFAAVLIYTRQIRALSLMALIAVVMPVGDALLVAQAGAPAATIVRHAVIAAIVLAAWFFLRRWHRAHGA